MLSVSGIPCPRCAYEAHSLDDLESHGKNAHTPIEEMTTAVMLPMEYVWLGPEAPAQDVTQKCPCNDPLWGMDITLAEPPEQVGSFEAGGAGHPALAIPGADPTFWMEDHVLRFLHTVGDRSQRGGIVNVLLVGPTGTGKSSLPREFAATWRRSFFTMHCQLVVEQGDWWGSKEISPEAGTYFQKAALVDAVETPGCVILLDEANRTHPENLNALFGLLDHRRRVWLPALERELAVAPGVVFFVTLNEGIDYVGTSSVDGALRDRISSTVRMDYLPREAETNILVHRTRIDLDAARKLVDFARAVRHNPKLEVGVSTRQLIECAALVAEGLALRDAVIFSVANGVLEDVHRKAMLQALQVTGDVPHAYVAGTGDDEE